MKSIQIFDSFLSFSFTLQLLTIVWFLRVKTTALVLIGWKVSIVLVFSEIGNETGNGVIKLRFVKITYLLKQIQVSCMFNNYLAGIYNAY